MKLVAEVTYSEANLRAMYSLLVREGNPMGTFEEFRAEYLEDFQHEVRNGVKSECSDFDFRIVEGPR